MLIGVLSDTHDRLPAIDAALAVFAERGVQALIHAGDFVAPFAVKRLLTFDGPVHAVYGNNDGERAGLAALIPGISDGPLVLEIGGRTIVVQHCIDDDHEPASGADIIIYGHTHEVVNRVQHGRLWLNPGECCGWVTGICTAAILDVDKRCAEIVDLDG